MLQPTHGWDFSCYRSFMSRGGDCCEQIAEGSTALFGPEACNWTVQYFVPVCGQAEQTDCFIVDVQNPDGREQHIQSIGLPFLIPAGAGCIHAFKQSSCARHIELPVGNLSDSSLRRRFASLCGIID